VLQSGVITNYPVKLAIHSAERCATNAKVFQQNNAA